MKDGRKNVVAVRKRHSRRFDCDIYESAGHRVYQQHEIEFLAPSEVPDHWFERFSVFDGWRPVTIKTTVFL